MLQTGALEAVVVSDISLGLTPVHNRSIAPLRYFIVTEPIYSYSWVAGEEPARRGMSMAEY